jgi:hypothetical protein
MIIYVDIDETICHYPTGVSSKMEYDKAVPIMSNIEKVNRMYSDGHTITYWTSRGVMTGINWRELTEAQLARWGALYHRLEMNKPFYHLFIDDRSINSLWDWDETSIKKIELTHK